ncbi:uncharacterized protein [Epargyreus clarus]|uniref:uncharacterized protein isoform X1 n=1 Tax=Epargyreus clarus TaxID=520877 RepID=UPI003C2CE446
MVHPVKPNVTVLEWHRPSVPTRLRCGFLLASLVAVSFLVLFFSNSADILYLSNEPPSPSWVYRNYEAFEADDTFTIKTQGCAIPGLRPFDEHIKKFIEQPKHKHCPKSNVSLLNNNETHIWIKTEHLQNYGLPSDSNISCCYKSFYRPLSIPDISSMDVDNRVKYLDCIEFSDYIEVLNEFVKVTCRSDDNNILHEQFFLFAPKKPYLSYADDSVEVPINQTSYNVIVMGVDAISRLNFYRTMPKTLAYLKKKDAIELFGYNKVGDNTFPNLTPMLLGLKDTDLKRICLPNSRATFDNCPFIWDLYKDAGYYTALGEDSASLGTFNFEKFGFSGTPTDYYIHTFMYEAERYAGNNRDFNSYICMGNKYFYKVLLDYIENLSSTLFSSKLFGFFWEVTMSHDYLNYPMIMDDSYLAFFKKLDETKYLENTIIIFLSDHGIRWGEIRFTKQGRLEERLPLAFILLPPNFREQYPLAYKNIKTNRRRLTTPFDVYATLKDVVNLNNLRDDNIKLRTSNSYGQDRSISLFLPIPSNRTCKTAGIDDHWCTCYRGKKVSSKNVEGRKAALHLVTKLNSMVRGHPRCAQLSLVDLLEATEMEVGTPGEHEVGWRELMVVVRTTPGDGIFEATLRHDSHDWSLAGSVSRLNLYGNQSHCVHNYQLKLYCYCQ